MLSQASGAHPAQSPLYAGSTSARSNPRVALPVLLGFVARISRFEIPAERVIILGTGPLARVTGQDLERRRQRVIGHLFMAGEERSPSLTQPVLGGWMELENALRENPVDEVYIASDRPNDAPVVQHAISVCENLGIPFALPAYTFRMQRARPVFGKAVADGYLHYKMGDPQTLQRALKRIFDVLVAAVALCLLAPLFLVVAVLIQTSSPGPIFFKQVRCGLRGKRFEMLKFRSMVADAEKRRKDLEALNQRSGPVFKLRRDPRVTRVGGVLRKYSLDELPQLINVLRGDMSIVGPRPPIPDEVAKYEPWQLRRLSVRPGLTCLWQASPARHQISFEDWMYLDLQYVDHWSFAHDLRIVVRTLPIVFSGGGEPEPEPMPISRAPQSLFPSAR
jgi:exopolysaccharide biosynthesis polyprenyl glycosylphosphotransferase